MVSQNKRRLRRNDKRLRRMEWEDERRKEPERMELARQAKKDTEIKMLARNERDRVDRELWYNSDTDALSHTARLLQRLPQELFDAIYEHVVSGVSESSIIKVEKHQYKPPMMLQITKPLRQKFMKTYYGTNIFSFTDPEVCSEWLETLAQDCINNTNMATARKPKIESAESRKWSTIGEGTLEEKPSEPVTYQLVEPIQALPQELYDIVRDCTVDEYIPFRTKIKIDKAYKPPMLLGLTERTRYLLSPKYYVTNVFSFTDLEIGHKWLAALAPKYSSRIRQICYDTRSTDHKHRSASSMQLYSAINTTFTDTFWKLNDNLVIWTPLQEHKGQSDDTWFRIQGSVGTYSIPDAVVSE
ncbi:unnamed protein product [Zymoseptoria tritici ST99CH_1E4]|uniref:Uncharacterized protein n=1 Tax=Zymoseptoria tritici ST99CH_1E4 TaxID=1276532 RepID=A0A2H1GXR0_ZYMTR|nr:unnamed protein product [Zymoseptoria tritici ST99CH_1E4]